MSGAIIYAYVGNNPFNRNDPSGLTAAAANMLGGKIGGYLDAITPGSLSLKNSYDSYQAGNYRNAAIYGMTGVLDIGATLATDGGYQALKGVVAGQGGRFASLVGTVGDDLTAHHIPQAALNFTTRADGGAIVMTATQHEATRTYGYNGAMTAIQDAGTSFRDVLAKDIRDVRSIVGSAYNEGLQNVTQYYRQNFPGLINKQ